MTDILTTHVGSLPRGPDLVPLLLARDHQQPYDTADFDRQVQIAVDDIVDRQVTCGVSIVSDGELGKVGYSTYMNERLSGFGGEVSRKPALDLAELPALRKKLAAIMGDQEFTRRACVGPVKLVNLKPCLDDIDRFHNALIADLVHSLATARLILQSRGKSLSRCAPALTLPRVACRRDVHALVPLGAETRTPNVYGR